MVTEVVTEVVMWVVFNTKFTFLLFSCWLKARYGWTVKYLEGSYSGLYRDSEPIRENTEYLGGDLDCC